MPMFDYRCKKCGRIDEYIVKMGQMEGPECKNCGSKALKKLMGVPNVSANPNHREPPQHTYTRNPIYD
jgi:putative FmdB family regulatory protein